MAKNSKFIAMIGVMTFTILGIIIANFLKNFIVNFNSTGLLASIEDFLLTPGLIDGLFWLLVCILVYIGIGKISSKNSKVGPISILFLLLWISAVIGLFIGNIIWELFSNKSVLINLDFIVKSLFLNLEKSLGPAFAGTLGLSNNGKSSHSGNP